MQDDQTKDNGMEKGRVSSPQPDTEGMKDERAMPIKVPPCGIA